MIAREELTGTMELFSVRGDLDFHWLRPADSGTWPWRGGVPVTFAWHEPELEPDPADSEEEFIPVDCLPMNTGCDGLILSDFARRTLEGLLLPAGELWPVRVLGHQYWWYNCLAMVNALDRDVTDADWEVVEGEWGEFRWIGTPRRLVFDPKALRDAPPVFRIPEFPQGVLFGGGAFAHAVVSNGLTGFRIDPVWSEGAGGVPDPAGFGFGDALEETDPDDLERKRGEARTRLLNRRARIGQRD